MLLLNQRQKERCLRPPPLAHRSLALASLASSPINPHEGTRDSIP